MNIEQKSKFYCINRWIRHIQSLPGLSDFINYLTTYKPPAKIPVLKPPQKVVPEEKKKEVKAPVKKPVKKGKK